MSSGPQGSASPSEPYEESSSQEFDHQGSESTSTEDSVPQGTNGNGNEAAQNDDGQVKHKRNTRFERAKRAREKHEAEFNQRQTALQQREAEFARAQAEFEASKKPKRDYSLAQLKSYRADWAREAQEGIIPGRAELVAKADAEIAAMEAEEAASKQVVEYPKFGTPDHTRSWRAAEADISQGDPDFMKPGTRIDKKLREIFAGPNGQKYRDHPQGIYAAYDHARREILEEDNKGLRTENSQLRKELQRYTGLTSIGGGAPGRMGGGAIASTADFARLSSAEMRKHLLAHSKRNNDSGGWL